MLLEPQKMLRKRGHNTCEQCDRHLLLCSFCGLCPEHCLFGAEVCKQCGGHMEGLEVPGGLYCEECACPECGTRFTEANVYVDDSRCTHCNEIEGHE